MNEGLRVSLPWQSGVLDPQGPIGLAERTILFNATAIMLAVVIPTIILTLVFAWWFRQTNTKARYLPDWSYSGSIEVVVWSIPVLVIVFLGGIAWVGSHDLDPAKPIESTVQPIRIQVVSMDWKWLFIYPDHGVAAVNRLVVPAATPISFQLTSATVMNSFFVPQLGSQIYTMAGMTTRLHLQADKPGTYPGISAQFSGEGFSSMRFDVVAQSESDFAAWLAATRSNGRALDATSYAELEKPTMALPPSTFGSVAANFFDGIVKMDMHGPTPVSTRPSAPAHHHGK
jgi:cytochrome o ubiquinol oxidase subunit II